LRNKPEETIIQKHLKRRRPPIMSAQSSIASASGDQNGNNILTVIGELNFKY